MSDTGLQPGDLAKGLFFFTVLVPMTCGFAGAALFEGVLWLIRAHIAQ